jgi:hypothetical protein
LKLKPPPLGRIRAATASHRSPAVKTRRLSRSKDADSPAGNPVQQIEALRPPKTIGEIFDAGSTAADCHCRE